MHSGTTEKFNSVIAGASRHFYFKMSRDGEEYTSGIRSVKISAQANSESKLSIGGTVATTVEISMEKPEERQLTGKEYQLFFGLEVDGENEWCPMCLITPEKPKEKDGILTFTAYDRMVSVFNSPYFTDITSFPTDGKNLLKEISSRTGVAIANLSDLPDGVMISNRKVASEDGETTVSSFDGYTYREAIKYLAQIYGTFAVMNREGELEFRWYTESGYTVELNRSKGDIESNELIYTVQKIECTVDQDTLTSGGGSTGIQIENPVMTQELLDQVFAQIGGMSYLPTTLSFLGDCRLDLGDIVTVKTNSGIDISVPVMSLEYEFDGGLTTAIGSYGSTETEESSTVKGPTAQALDRVYTDLFLVKTVLANKVSTDYLETTYATIKQLDAVEARIEKIVSTEITVEYLETKYAQIDMANVDIASIEQGFLKELMVEQGILADRVISEEVKVTNCLTGVSILANDIVAGRLDAAEIEVVNLNCANLTVGQINGTQIASGAIDMDNLEESLSNTITTTATDVENALKEVVLAKSDAAAAQKTADGKNTVYYTDETPEGAKVNDIWFKDGTIYIYNGTKWALEQFGENAIEDQAITNAKIADATIQSAKIANLDAGKITSGYISADRIDAGSITYAKLSSGAVASINALIEVGGRNLLPNTKTMEGYVCSSYVSISEDTEGIAVATYSTNTNIAYNSLRTMDPIPYSQVRNKTVTFSFWIRSDDYESINAISGHGLHVDARIYAATSITTLKYAVAISKGSNYQLSNEWEKVVITATFSDEYFKNGSGTITDDARFAFIIYNYSTYSMQVKKLKLELGNKATDWTPNPDDVYAEIAEQGIGNWCYNNDLTYINGGKIYTGTITTEKLAASSVTAVKIASGAIIADKIAASAVNAAKIATGAVETDKIAAGAVTTTQIASRTITADRIVAGAITANEIAASTITAAEIKSRTITADRIVAGAITAKEIAAATITADRMNVSSLEAIVAKIGGFTINSTALYNGTSSKTSTTAGIYLGTNAIRAYSSASAYTHIESGKLTCVGAEIKGDMTILGSLKMVCSGYNETPSTIIRHYLDTSGATTEFCGYLGNKIMGYNSEEGILGIALDTVVSGALQCTGTFQCAGTLYASIITATSAITGGTVKTTAGANLDTLYNQTKLTSWSSDTVVSQVVWYKTRGFVFTYLNGYLGNTFDNLPSGYRPKAKVWFPVIVQNTNASSGGWFTGWMGIGTDGSIVIQATGSHGGSWTNCETTTFSIYGFVIFYAGT